MTCPPGIPGLSSIVAGVCEDTRFRGYLQVPLEKKNGPFLGIAITSLIFVIVHIHQAWTGGILVQIFIISMMLGYLAYASGSLIPGMIAHTLFDIVNFTYWWSDMAGTFNRKPVSVTGWDLHFITSTLIVLVSLIVFVYLISKMEKLIGIDENKLCG